MLSTGQSERHAKLRRVQAHRTLSERLAASPSRPCLRRCRPRASKARKIDLDVSISRRCENGKVVILKSSVLMDAVVALVRDEVVRELWYHRHPDGRRPEPAPFDLRAALEAGAEVLK